MKLADVQKLERKVELLEKEIEALKKAMQELQKTPPYPKRPRIVPDDVEPWGENPRPPRYPKYPRDHWLSSNAS